MINNLPSCASQLQAIANTKRMTQKEFMSAAGISRTASSHYFNGQSEPRFAVLQKWGVLFNLNMNWLFYGEGPMFKTPKPDPRPEQDGAALRNQVAHLRLIHDNSKPAESAQTESREVTLKQPDKNAYEAQIRLIDHVCESLAKNGASQEMIQRAILALVSGAF